MERIRKAVDAEPLDPATATEIACRVEREPEHGSQETPPRRRGRRLELGP